MSEQHKHRIGGHLNHEALSEKICLTDACYLLDEDAENCMRYFTWRALSFAVCQEIARLLILGGSQHRHPILLPKN